MGTVRRTFCRFQVHLDSLHYLKRAILDLFESDNLISSKEDIENYIKVAKNTVEKNAKISIRVNEKDLRKVKSKAIEIGVPYQTLIMKLMPLSHY